MITDTTCHALFLMLAAVISMFLTKRLFLALQFLAIALAALFIAIWSIGGEP